MTKTTESVLFLFSPPMQACYSLSSAPTPHSSRPLSSMGMRFFFFGGGGGGARAGAT